MSVYHDGHLLAAHSGQGSLRIVLRTRRPGTYRVQVSAKDRMELSLPDDTCGPRKLGLSDPFVYAS